jgi:signal transduction histidine kinase
MQTRAEYYLGVLVWLIVIVVNLVIWPAESSIQLPFIHENIILTACIYLLYLIGYSFCAWPGFSGYSKRFQLAGWLTGMITASALSVLFMFPISGFLYTLLLIRMVDFTAPRVAMSAAILLPVVGVLVDYFIGKGFEFPVMAIFCVINLLALMTHYRMLSERKIRQVFEAQTRELRATQTLLEESITREERLRISRDIHDLLGHQLTALTLQLEVATHVQGDQIQAHLEQAKNISNQLLQDVRTVVSTIRESTDYNIERLFIALTENIPGLQVNLVLDLKAKISEFRVIETLFSITQEALTNTLRHSHATNCDIALYDRNRQLHLIIHDNGECHGNILPGNGLTGIRERVNKLDGEFSYDNRQGFRLTVCLPHEGVAA